MSKEIVSTYTQAELLVDHNNRHHGTSTLLDNRAFGAAVTLRDLSTTINPSLVKGHDVSGVNLNYVFRTEVLYEYPLIADVALSRLIPHDSYSFRLEGTGFVDSLMSSKFVYYRNDHKAYLTYVGGNWLLQFDLPSSTPFLAVGQYLAIETAYGAPERIVYAHVTNLLAVPGQDVVVVTVVPLAGTWTWSSFIKNPTSDTDTLLLTVYPYTILTPLTDIDITVTSATYPAINGTWNFSQRGGYYYLSSSSVLPTLGGTVTDAVAQLKIDAVNYNLSVKHRENNTLLITGPFTNVKHSLAFFREDDVINRDFSSPSETRYFKFNTRTDNPYFAFEFYLPTPGDTSFNISGYYSSVFAQPPRDVPVLVVSDVNSSTEIAMINVSLGGKDKQVSAITTTDRENHLRYTNAASNAIPSGVIVPFRAPFAPPAWKEVFGQVNEEPGSSTESADRSANLYYYFPKDTFIPFQEGMGIGVNTGLNYIESENVTRLTFNSVSTGFTDKLVTGEMYDWGSSYKTVDVELLPAPNPESATVKLDLSGGLGIGVVKIKLGKMAPKLPSRVRKAKVPQGENKLIWPSGVQLYVVKEPHGLVVPDRYSHPMTCNVAAAVVAKIKVDAIITVKETGATGVTFPPEYPNSLLQNIALLIMNNNNGTLGKWASKFYKWYDKYINKLTPPSLEYSVSSGSTVSVDIIGNWVSYFESVITPFPSASLSKNDNILFFVKTGYLKNDIDDSGSFSFGAEQHNHIFKELTAEKLVKLNVELSGYNVATQQQHFPPTCQNHGHGYIGEGSFNRPQALAVKMILKV